MNINSNSTDSGHANNFEDRKSSSNDHYNKTVNNNDPDLAVGDRDNYIPQLDSNIIITRSGRISKSCDYAKHFPDVDN